jgi:hypothetical protein
MMRQVEVQPAAGSNGPPELHHGVILKLPIHNCQTIPQIQRASAQTLISVHDNHWSWPLCVGVSPHPLPHTTLLRTQISKTVMRAPPPPICHRDYHCTLHDNSNLPAPWILCTLAATQPSAHPAAPQPPPPIAQTAGLQLRRFKKGHDA